MHSKSKILTFGFIILFINNCFLRFLSSEKRNEPSTTGSIECAIISIIFKPILQMAKISLLEFKSEPKTHKIPFSFSYVINWKLYDRIKLKKHNLFGWEA